ncbi:MAG TPA: hypothetical protein VHQ90_17435 [Thermoanaerobaculia bacterium]|nr:hypothetical protein [Thermoanaerobaculia bacterium]
MYYMIHAADHPESHKIMNRAYNKAVGPREALESLNLSLFADPSEATQNPTR